MPERISRQKYLRVLRGIERKNFANHGESKTIGTMQNNFHDQIVESGNDYLIMENEWGDEIVSRFLMPRTVASRTRLLVQDANPRLTDSIWEELAGVDPAIVKARAVSWLVHLVDIANPNYTEDIQQVMRLFFED